MLNKIYYILFFSILICCNKNVKKSFINEEKEKEPLFIQINHIVDSMSKSFPKEYPVNLYTVTHQKESGKDYIKVSTAEFYNKDSLSGGYLHNGEVVILYSKKFFTKYSKNEFKPDNIFEYKNGTISLYHPRYTIFEILNSSYKKISTSEANKMNLFDYSDRYIPELVPQKK